jgi:hypothetical protein
MSSSGREVEPSRKRPVSRSRPVRDPAQPHSLLPRNNSGFETYQNAATLKHEKRIQRELLVRLASMETTPFSNKIVHFHGYAYADFHSWGA